MAFISHVYVDADPGLWPIIDRERLGNISLRAMSGRLMVVVETIENKALRLVVRPKVAFSDEVASRLVSTLEFLYRIGSEVPA